MCSPVCARVSPCAHAIFSFSLCVLCARTAARVCPCADSDPKNAHTPHTHPHTHPEPATHTPCCVRKTAPFRPFTHTLAQTPDRPTTTRWQNLGRRAATSPRHHPAMASDGPGQRRDVRTRRRTTALRWQCQTPRAGVQSIDADQRWPTSHNLISCEVRQVRASFRLRVARARAYSVETMPPLQTGRWERFAVAYVQTGRATDAYRIAVPKSQKWKATSVQSRSSALFRRPEVQARILELQSQAAQAATDGIASKSDVLRALSRSALACPTDVIAPDGSVDLARLRACRQEVAGVEVVDRPEGRQIRVRYRDGIAAAERLAKLLGWDQPQQVQVAATVEDGGVTAALRAMPPDERRAWLDALAARTAAPDDLPGSRARVSSDDDRFSIAERAGAGESAFSDGEDAEGADQ